MTDTTTITPNAPLLHQPKDQWCIWTKTGRRPRYYHNSHEEAMAEAERLALKHPGKKFIVMHMTDKISATTTEQVVGG